MIQRKLKVPWRHQCMLQGNVQQENSRIVANYPLNRNNTITFVLSMCGRTPDGTEFAPTCMHDAPETVVNGVPEAATYLAL